MKTIQQHKQDATLNKIMRFEEGVMSRRQWLNLQRIKGATVEQSTKNRIQFNRIKYNRMSEGQEEYERKCAERVPCYNLHLPGQSSFYEITKTEFDYFNNMELAEDLATQRHDLQNRIEAGIATPQEIEADMKEEIEMMNKYYC